MFTGIVAKTAKVSNVSKTKNGMVLEIENTLGKLRAGDSISVNGVCSTIKKSGRTMLFEYMPETIKLSNVSFLEKWDSVNLEQSMRLGDKFDGHIVLGHIDTTGKLMSIKKEGNSQIFTIRVPNKKFMKFIVYKGSIAIEGISLTVTKVVSNSFSVKIIPYTWEHTNLQYKKKDDALNIEFDILAKYAYAGKK